MRIAADFLIEHASLVATCAGPAPRRGAAQRDITPLRDASIASHQGVIVYVGPSSDAERSARAARRRHAARCARLHGRSRLRRSAHALVFAGDRRDELRRRLAGATYEAIAAEGGGIMKTVALTRAASETELADAARPRLDEMLAAGTTTCEAKSGYGLTTESELTQLRAIHAAQPQPHRSTSSRRFSARTTSRPSSRRGAPTTSPASIERDDSARRRLKAWPNGATCSATRASSRRRSRSRFSRPANAPD